MLENTGQQTNQKQRLQKLKTTQKKQTTENTAKQVLSLLMTRSQEMRVGLFYNAPEPTRGMCRTLQVVNVYLLNTEMYRDDVDCVCAGEVVRVNYSRLLLCEATANVMKQGFTILGLSTVERM